MLRNAGLTGVELHRHAGVSPGTDKDTAMRRLLAASALLLSMSAATPSLAGGYPWCIGIPKTGDVRQCRFTSWEQCQATANGLGVGCYPNPAGAPRSGRYVGPRANGWQDDDWQNHNRRW
jgi:uncharacterized protein DUF3551